MAKRILEILSDDIDGTTGEDVETLTFSINGNAYEIDLNADNRHAFDADLSRYVDAARRQPRTYKKRQRSGASA